MFWHNAEEEGSGRRTVVHFQMMSTTYIEKEGYECPNKFPPESETTKAQKLHLRLYRPQLKSYIFMFMTIIIRKKIHPLLSKTYQWQQGLGFKSWILTNQLLELLECPLNKSPKWRCVAIIPNSTFGEKKTQTNSISTVSTVLDVSWVEVVFSHMTWVACSHWLNHEHVQLQKYSRVKHEVS